MNKKRRQSIRVILVDDEDVVLDTLTAFLEDWGFQVFTADEGDKGIEILKEQPMDIAIVDIRLRGYDGNTFILKAHELQPGLKFLIHTGSSSYTVPPELAALGISEKDIFLKPIRDFKMLLDTIDRKTGN
jgi:DNA-binding NtrC family response regulator